jgi:Translation elongation factor Ts
LRHSTGAGFQDCNAALIVSNGVLVLAAGIFRVKGIAKASIKMSRTAKEGVIVVSKDDKKTSLFEINCDTDFVAKNEDFINFAKELSVLNNKCSSDIDNLNQSLMKNPIKVADNLVSFLATVGAKKAVGRTKTFHPAH